MRVRPITLHGSVGAYLVVDGTDLDPRRPDEPCLAYRRFAIMLPGDERTIDVPATAPGYAAWFPDCGPVQHSVLVARSVLTVRPFNGR